MQSFPQKNGIHELSEGIFERAKILDKRTTDIIAAANGEQKWRNGEGWFSDKNVLYKL